MTVYDRNSYTMAFYCCKIPAEMLALTEGEITVFAGHVSFDATEFAHFWAVAPHGQPRGDCSDNATEHLLAFIWMTDLKHGTISGKDLCQAGFDLVLAADMNGALKLV